MSAINRMALLDVEARQFGVSTNQFVGQLNGTKTYINGVEATKSDLLELERNLKAGIERAIGKCYNGIIYFKTI